MIAIFCETPYQLLNALNLVYSEFREECVLYVMKDMFKSNVRFDINVKNKGYIKSVKEVRRDTYKISFFSRALSKLYGIVAGHKKRIIRRHITNVNLKERYDKFICIKYSFAASLVYDYMKEKPEVYQVEEGIGEYLLLNDFDYADNKNNICNHVKCKYISEPRLYPRADKFNLKKSPYLSTDMEFTDLLENIFHYRKELPLYKRYIYFGQAFAQDYENPEFENIEGNCFKIFAEILDYDDLSIKKHPRNTSDICDEFGSIHTLAPWECCINELDDIENRVIISISSTALITPKLMCDKEPYLIVLAKLYAKELKKIYTERNYYDKLIELFEQVKVLYRDSNKVFIPESMDELKTILKQQEGENL